MLFYQDQHTFRHELSLGSLVMGVALFDSCGQDPPGIGCLPNEIFIHGLTRSIRLASRAHAKSVERTRR